MAGDWIKMRVGLTTSPRVMRIAECLLDDSKFLGWSGFSFGVAGYPAPSEEDVRAERHAALRVTRYVTVTALLKFWGYANEHVKGEFIASIYPEDIDEIVGVPGFAAAISSAGWVVFNPNGGLSMPNFAEHNTSAGERSSGAERQKRYREKAKGVAGNVTSNSDVTRDVTVTPREEKRREENKSSPVVPTGDEEAILSAYHSTLPRCKRCEVLNPKRKKRIKAAVRLARSTCATQGWPYDAAAFWAAYFAECAKDPWMRGDVPYKDNPAWKQNLESLIAEDRFAGVMDSAIASMRATA